MPKTKKKFWQQKFDANVKRDRQVRRKLRDLGWHSAVIWECKTRDRDKLAKYLLRLLRGGE